MPVAWLVKRKILFNLVTEGKLHLQLIKFCFLTDLIQYTKGVVNFWIGFWKIHFLLFNLHDQTQKLKKKWKLFL